jgi:hypothetical protein
VTERHGVHTSQEASLAEPIQPQGERHIDATVAEERAAPAAPPPTQDEVDDTRAAALTAAVRRTKTILNRPLLHYSYMQQLEHIPSRAGAGEAGVRGIIFACFQKASFELSSDHSTNSRERDRVKTRPCIDSMRAALHIEVGSQWLVAVIELSGPKVQFLLRLQRRAC